MKAQEHTRLIQDAHRGLIRAQNDVLRAERTIGLASAAYVLAYELLNSAILNSRKADTDETEAPAS